MAAPSAERTLGRLREVTNNEQNCMTSPANCHNLPTMRTGDLEREKSRAVLAGMCGYQEGHGNVLRAIPTSFSNGPGDWPLWWCPI